MKNLINYICLTLMIFYVEQSYCQMIPPSEKVVKSRTEMPLADKVNKSDVVIEGTVINDTRSDCFFGPKGSIFTSVMIRASRIFKGDIKDTLIEVVIEGGTIPSGPYEGIHGGPEGGGIGKDQEGIFFLRYNNSNIKSGKKTPSFFFLYFNSYIRYDLHSTDTSSSKGIYHTTYYDGKNRSDFEIILYKPIEAITGMPAKSICPMSFEIAEKLHPIMDTVFIVGNRRIIVPKKDIGKFLDTLKKQSGK